MQHAAKARGIPSAIITFPVHPQVILHSDYQPKLLNSQDEKLELLSKTGIDYIIVMDFTPELAALTAREFISTVLVPEWRVQTLLVGHDHHFGRRRHNGGFEQFTVDGMYYGLEVVKTSLYGSDNGAVINSSAIRGLIENGDVTAASRLLGYPYRLKGHVINGRRLGRRLGFPTANIAVDEKFKVIPRSGSYAVRITVDNTLYSGMSYVGSRPTAGTDDALSIEAHIFDFSKDIYDESITVAFIDFLREEMKFDSLDELREQIEADKRKT
jgi:riboflavin kinase/FMN adenylyltransferase